MMRIYLYTFLCIIFCAVMHAQIGINTPLPNANTLLHISEKNNTKVNSAKGIILPRLNQQEIDNLAYEDPLVNPKKAKLTQNDNGLLVYNTSTNCFNFWHSKDEEWKTLCTKSGSLDDLEGDPEMSEYTFDCKDIIIEGNYMINQALDAEEYSNYLLVPVKVTKPGVYTFVGSTTNGFGYVASGVFTAPGDYTIKAVGQGTPSQEGPFALTLLSNHIEATCKSTVTILGPNSIGGKLHITRKMKILAIGNWGAFESNVQIGLDNGKSIAQSQYNFGQLSNSIVDYVGWEDFNSITNGEDLKTSWFNRQINRDKIKELLTKTPTYAPYDILIIHTNFGFGDDSKGGASNNLYSTLFSDYLDNGGVILMYGGSVRSSALNDAFFQKVFPQSPAGTFKLTEGAPVSIKGPGYSFTNVKDLNIAGPFGDIRNKSWLPAYTRDRMNHFCYYYGNLPMDKIVVLSTDGTASNVTAFRHTSKHLLWVGDSAFFSSSGFNKDYRTKHPLSQPLFNGPVYNSIFYANNLAWALSMAQTSGINTRP